MVKITKTKSRKIGKVDRNPANTAPVFKQEELSKMFSKLNKGEGLHLKDDEFVAEKSKESNMPNWMYLTLLISAYALIVAGVLGLVSFGIFLANNVTIK